MTATATPSIPENHPCSAWCHPDDGVHVDLAHWDPDRWTDGEIRRAWEAKGATVTRIEPAREAPHREPDHPAGPRRAAHLVWWQT